MARNNRKIFLLQAPAPNPALQPGNILIKFYSISIAFTAVKHSTDLL